MDFVKSFNKSAITPRETRKESILSAYILATVASQTPVASAFALRDFAIFFLGGLGVSTVSSDPQVVPIGQLVDCVS